MPELEQPPTVPPSDFYGTDLNDPAIITLRQGDFLTFPRAIPVLSLRL